ncbi:Hypothetical_protein [Hexamita inflata]|uniref:Hypothetical_protein n=1 Tax=Hexamita inflata TaxID=28002 RepID=A0AA86TGJ6_9EUKA|nr:Hypothetical protein HINF_LOCUS3182 [Hexamita inflata]
MFSSILVLQYQAFTISEFQFCYNYVFDSPFQENLSLNMSTTFTFDGAVSLGSCTETQNVIFRHVNSSVVQLQLNLDVDTQQSTSFALFFYIFKNVEIQNSIINLNLKNGSNKDANLLVHTSPEFTISIFSTVYNVKSDSSSFKNVYGISKLLDQKLTLNQSSFTLGSGVTKIINVCVPMAIIKEFIGMVVIIIVMINKFVVQQIVQVHHIHVLMEIPTGVVVHNIVQTWYDSLIYLVYCFGSQSIQLVLSQQFYIYTLYSYKIQFCSKITTYLAIVKQHIYIYLLHLYGLLDCC